MHPQPLFCLNLACPSRGLENAGNITVHAGLEDRFVCRSCRQTFVTTKGTLFYRLKTDPKIVVQVLVLLAYGCPVQAIVQAFGLDARTLRTWQKRAGQHCQQVHTALVSSACLDLQQVQADEIRVKVQRHRIVWMALALCVPTRLWLGGVVSLHRDKHLARALAHQVQACAARGPLLLLSDGWTAYVDAWKKAFRTPARTGKPGRPRLLAWPQVVIGQVVKQYQKGRVTGIEPHLRQGTLPQLWALWAVVPTFSTAYIERLNATFRQRLSCLCRRSRALARLPETVEAGMYLVGCVYNFCTPHQSLAQEQERTPAMAAGLSEYVWSVEELLCFRVAPPPYVAKKRRGRKPKTQAPVAKGANQLVTL